MCYRTRFHRFQVEAITMCYHTRFTIHIFTDFRLKQQVCATVNIWQVSFEMPHFMQFSAAACEWCMLHCVLFDCNGRKCTGNGFSIPAAACSPQLLRETQDILWRNTLSCLAALCFFVKWCEEICINVWLPYTVFSINVWLPYTVNMQFFV